MTFIFQVQERPYPSIFFSDFNPSDIVLKSSVKDQKSCNVFVRTVF